MGRAWNVQSDLEAEGPVGVLRVMEKKAQDLQGGTQSSAITYFW